MANFDLVLHNFTRMGALEKTEDKWENRSKATATFLENLKKENFSERNHNKPLIVITPECRWLTNSENLPVSLCQQNPNLRKLYETTGGSSTPNKFTSTRNILWYDEHWIHISTKNYWLGSDNYMPYYSKNGWTRILTVTELLPIVTNGDILETQKESYIFAYTHLNHRLDLKCRELEDIVKILKQYYPDKKIVLAGDLNFFDEDYKELVKYMESEGFFHRSKFAKFGKHKPERRFVPMKGDPYLPKTKEGESIFPKSAAMNIFTLNMEKQDGHEVELLAISRRTSKPVVFNINDLNEVKAYQTKLISDHLTILDRF